MPTVPSYGGQQVRQQANPSQQFQLPAAPDVAGQQAQQIGQGMQRAGQVVSSIEADMQARANAARLDDGTNQLVAGETDLRVKASMLKGRNALERPDGKSLPDEYGEQLDKLRDDISAKLGNEAQRSAFRNIAGRISTRFRGALSDHTIRQQEVFEDDTYKSTVGTATNQGALFYGDPKARQESYDVIRGAVNATANRKGWDEKTREVEFSNAITPMHASIMNTLIKGGRAEDAKAYYDANNAEMTVQARANMQGVLMESVAAQKSEAFVSDVWNKAGPKSANEPVKMFDMEADLRERLKGDPDTLKRATADLRSRAQAFNAQQAEMKAVNTSSVWNLLDAGSSFSDVQRSDAWLAMDGTERHKIRKAVADDRASAASTAASNASSELSQMQTQERMNYMRNGDKYLTATDPDVLRNMSRAQVEATRTDFGMDATKQLLSKWDTLQKPGKLAEAKIDRDDFNQVAGEMGLRPYKTSRSEDEKRALGTLQFRVEQMVDAEQAKSGKPMDRQAKMQLMRQELARTVTVDKGFFSSEKQVPVISMSSDQVKDVVVPDADRSMIVAALKSKYQQSPGNKNYEPTEANVRRLYLLNASPAGAYLNAGK